MFIICNICNKETIILDNILNKCQYCDCSIFIGNKVDKIEEFSQYNEIIEDLSIKVNMEKEIIEKMFRLSLISSFGKRRESYAGRTQSAVYLPAIRFSKEKEKLIIFIEKYIDKKNKYPYSYLYFKYNLNNENTYLDEFKEVYMHFKNNTNIILSLKQDTMSMEILGINIRFNLQDFCKHPIQWLTKEERVILQKNIDNKFKIYPIGSEYYIRYVIRLDLNKYFIEDLLKDIDIEIYEFTKLNHLEKEKMKEENLKYFERALLEREMKNF